MCVKTGKAAHTHVEVGPSIEIVTRVYLANTRGTIAIAMSSVITESVSLVAGANVPAGGQVIVVMVRIIEYGF